jgi:hypothetical protein
MDRNGTLNQETAHVNLDIDGILNFAKNLMCVRTAESGIPLISSACAPTDHIGVDMPVFQLKNVLEDNTLIHHYLNAPACLDSNGMVRLACNATMVGLGMLQLCPAPAPLELSKLRMAVDFNRLAQVENSGFKIHGVANALRTRFGMVTSVWPIPA